MHIPIISSQAIRQQTIHRSVVRGFDVCVRAAIELLFILNSFSHVCDIVPALHGIKTKQPLLAATAVEFMVATGVIIDDDHKVSSLQPSFTFPARFLLMAMRTLPLHFR